jgi:YfiH family protein
MAQRTDKNLSAPEFLTHPVLAAVEGLIHGFATAGPSPEHFKHESDAEAESVKRASVRESLRAALKHAEPAFDTVLTVKQVHSPYSLVVHREDRFVPTPDSIQCDAIISDRPGLIVAVKTADCLPILAVDPDRRVVAAVHAGWRGTYKGILYHALRRMVGEFHSKAENIRLVFGPSARACCYEVDNELAAAFKNKFGELVVRKAEPRLHLDLVEANRLLALRIGLRSEHIGDMESCTMCCADPLFYSWRRDGGHTGRLVNVIGLSGEAAARGM